MTNIVAKDNEPEADEELERVEDKQDDTFLLYQYKLIYGHNPLYQTE